MNLSFSKACTLGDGCLGYPKGKNTCYLSFTHSEKQKQFLEWKITKINQELGTKGKVNSRKIYDKRTLKTYYSCQSMVTSKLLVPLREQFYPQGKKLFSKNYLYDLGLEALAIFWMDDGCVVSSNNVGLLATYCTEKEAKTIASWIHDLTKVNPRLYLDRGLYRLRILSGEMPGFVTLIKPHMHSTLQNKVTLRYKNRTKNSEIYAASLNIAFADEDDKRARAQDKQYVIA